MARSIALLILIYVLSQAFDSVVRWVLNSVGVAGLIYVRDYLLILVVCFCTYLCVRRRQNVVKLYFLCSIFLLETCVALYSHLAIGQILFGLKVWLPFIAGFLVVESGEFPRLDRQNFWLTLWALLCAGIVLNHFYRYPWAGMTVEIGDVHVVANREWEAGGLQRISGFSRSSYDGATLILLLYVYLVVRRSRLLRMVPIVLLSGIAIALTTSKGVLGAFLGCTGLILFLRQDIAGSAGKRLVAFGALLFAATVGMIAPLVSLQMPFPRLQSNTVQFWLFSSLLDRAWNTWPDALSAVSGGQVLTGLGIGGIGASQLLGDPPTFTLSDNLFVFLYVTAGVAGALFYVLLAFGARVLTLTKRLDQGLFLLLFSVFAYGFASNVIESPTLSLALGGTTSFLLLQKNASIRLAGALLPKLRHDPAASSKRAPC